MNHLSLCTGIAGIDLAAEWAGFKTVAVCEAAEWPQKLLRLQFPDAIIFEDVKDVGRESLSTAGITPSAIKLVSGGWPCQPFSSAGEQRGIEDDRYLWPEIARILEEIRPDWFVGENVTGFAELGLQQTILDLEALGYEVAVFDIPACAVGSPDERRRLFIVANTTSNGQPEPREHFEPVGYAPYGFGEADPFVDAFQKGALPYVCGRHDGVPPSMDRIKALGNAVKPQHVYPILKAIALIERIPK